MMPAVTVNFSELINSSRSTAALVETHSSVLLRRRDGEDLVLSTKDQWDAERSYLSTATRFMVALMRDDARGRQVAMDLIGEVFPWTHFLPDNEIGEFAAELAETARAADSIGNVEATAALVAAWRHTAEVHADPELAAILGRDFGDGDAGPAPIPPLPAEGQ